MGVDVSIKPILFSCNFESDSNKELAVALRLLAASIDKGNVVSGSLAGSTTGQYVHFDASPEIAQLQQTLNLPGSLRTRGS